MWVLAKGGSMNYQEVLDNLHDYVTEKLREDDLSVNHFIIEFNSLQQLIDERIEQESRKDKLTVGSTWECVAACFVVEIPSIVVEIPSEAKLTSILTVLSDTCEFIGNDNLMTSVKVNDKHYIIPTSQFLICFKPIKEGE